MAGFEGATALSQKVCKIDACHLFASSLVRDGEDGVLVVFFCRMPDESGEHEGGMSGALLYIALGILKLSGPGVVWGICQLLVGEERVVVTDIAVGIGYLITEVIGIDVGRLVGLMQADDELLGITNQTDGMACNLQVFYFNQFVAESLPECIERLALVVYLALFAVETGMEGGDVVTLLWQSYLEFGTWLRKCIFVFLLEGEGCESVFARFQIDSHGIVRVLERL